MDDSRVNWGIAVFAPEGTFDDVVAISESPARNCLATALVKGVGMRLHLQEQSP